MTKRRGQVSENETKEIKIITLSSYPSPEVLFLDPRYPAILATFLGKLNYSLTFLGRQIIFISPAGGTEFLKFSQQP